MNRNDVQLTVTFSENTAHVTALHVPSKISVTQTFHPELSSLGVEWALEDLEEELKRSGK